jgi:hypothetical protein
MTSKTNASNFGPPPAVVELTMEQQFKLRQIEDALNKSKGEVDAIISLFLALQKQCFVLGNNVSNLVKQWPTAQNITVTLGKSETSSETKD